MGGGGAAINFNYLYAIRFAIVILFCRAGIRVFVSVSELTNALSIRKAARNGSCRPSRQWGKRDNISCLTGVYIFTKRKPNCSMYYFACIGTT